MRKVMTKGHLQKHEDIMMEMMEIMIYFVTDQINMMITWTKRIPTSLKSLKSCQKITSINFNNKYIRQPKQET